MVRTPDMQVVTNAVSRVLVYGIGVVHHGFYGPRVQNLLNPQKSFCALCRRHVSGLPPAASTPAGGGLLRWLGAGIRPQIKGTARYTLVSHLK